MPHSRGSPAPRTSSQSRVMNARATATTTMMTHCRLRTPRHHASIATPGRVPQASTGGPALPIRYPATNAATTSNTMPMMFPVPCDKRGFQERLPFERVDLEATREGRLALRRLEVVDAAIRHHSSMNRCSAPAFLQSRRIPRHQPTAPVASAALTRRNPRPTILGTRITVKLAGGGEWHS